jgi:DNA mismatch repair protein MutS2
MAALSAQSGIPVAAQRAELPLFDQVLADIGDEQSISADLSTFSAHVMNLRRMLEAATERSLVLVDEMGTGTAPEEGAALAVALLEEFRARRCLTLATTHHDRLKSYASTATGVLNAAVEFDEVHLQPTYRLLIGVPGTSSGIEIARRLGLPPQVIERARAGMTPEAREAAELIAYLHRSRDELEALKRQAMEQMRELDDERKKLQTEWVERQRKRLTELEKQFAETLKQHEADVARLAAEIKNRELRAQLEKQAERGSARARTQAREDVDAAVVAHLAESQADLGITMAPAARPVTQDELIEGARVRVRGFAAPVVIRRIDGRNADVDAGPLRMKVALSDVTAILSEEIAGPKAAPKRGFVGAPPGEPASRGVTVHSKPAEEPDADEINVIGCTVEEATRRVDKFIDAAAIASKPLVRIVHGHGTGALRRGLAEFLKAHPLVEKISNETPERGGTAITIAELKG